MSLVEQDHVLGITESLPLICPKITLIFFSNGFSIFNFKVANQKYYFVDAIIISACISPFSLGPVHPVRSTVSFSECGGDQ